MSVASLQFILGRMDFGARGRHGVFAFLQDLSGYKVEMG